MSQQEPPQERGPLTEEELRNLSEEGLQELYIRQYNEEMRQIRVEDLIAQTVVTLVNVAGRRAGLVPGSEEEVDAAQLKLAIDGARALLATLPGGLGPDGAQVEQALSQLQLAYVQIAGAAGPAGGAPGAAAAAAADEKPEQPGPAGAQGPGPAQASGRLWVPGQ